MRLTYIAVLLISCSAEPRSPRIYNVLITSKKNLAPSHAQPVYEPVLRTTSIGYAFPSLYYHTTFVQNVPTTYISADYSGIKKIDSPFPQEGDKASLLNAKLQPQLPFINTQNAYKSQQVPQDTSENEPVSSSPLIPQFNPYGLNPENHIPPNEEVSTSIARTSLIQQEESDPKRIIANLKKNPEIPDVPPPPLPVKTQKTV